MRKSETVTIVRVAWKVGMLWASLMAASSARAGDVARDFGLGPIPEFGSEASARAACHGDGVVWVDHSTGFYYPKFVQEYGTTPAGTFACYRDAKRANYWGFGTADALEGRSERVFPRSDCIWIIDKNRHATCGSAGS